MQTLLDSLEAPSDIGSPRHEQSTTHPPPGIEQLLGSPLDSTALAEVLEEIDTGVLVCSANGHIAMANDAGRRELQRGNPLAVDADGWLLLAGSNEAGSTHFRAALWTAVTTRRRQLLALHDGKQRLMVAVTPLGQLEKRALVLLGRRQPAPDLAVEMFGMLCELTHSERAVLVALIGGQRVESIARCRGVTIATVRSQVCALRAKLGVRRLEDFVRMAAVLPPIASALRTPHLGGRFDRPEAHQGRAATVNANSRVAAGA